MKQKIHQHLIYILSFFVLFINCKEKDDLASHQTIRIIASGANMGIDSWNLSGFDFAFENNYIGCLYMNDYISPSSFTDVFIYKTIDGGINWSLIYSDNFPYGVYGIISIAPDTCLVLTRFYSVGIIKLNSYLNGGMDWYTSNLNGINGVAVDWTFDIQKNLVMAFSGNELEKPYQNKVVRIRNNSIDTLFKSDTLNFRGVQISFPTIQDGYILINNASNSRFLYFTHTSGDSWNYSKPPKDIWTNDIVFITRDVGYAACDSGFLFKTIDGGLNWTKLITNTTKNCNYIQFLNNDDGYCVGDSGTILVTHNGQDWHSWETEITETIKKIQMIDTNNGYLATPTSLYKIEK